MPRILSIDGGGIRGIVPALVLADLEQRTGRAVGESFDLLAGTSTGGIIALALTCPAVKGGAAYTADDVVEFYAALGPTLFARSTMHRARTLDSLVGPRFDAKPLERALADFFGEARLSQCLRDVLVTSYDIERREPFFFKSHYARLRPERDFALRDVARATSAGPTYLAPARVATDDHIGYRSLVDGGVFANNPAMCGWVEALNLFGAPAVAPLATGVETPLPVIEATSRGAGPLTAHPIDTPELPPEPPRAPRPGTAGRTVLAHPRPDYPFRPRVATWDAEWLVVSLGTGHNEREIPHAKARGWGLASWARSIVDIVFDGVSDTVDYQMRQILPAVPGTPARYFRFQTDLDEASPELGDASPENIRRLKQTGYELVREQSRPLAEIAARLR